MKRLLTLMCAVLCVFALTACGGTKEELNTETMQTTIDTLLSQCYSTTEEQVAQLSDVRAEELDLALVQYGIPCDSKAYIGILQSWMDAKEEMGEFIDVGEFTFKEQNGEILAEAEAQYEDRNADMTFTFNATTGDVKALSVGAHYTTGEILKKSGLNTIVGMGIVFTVLIFIAIVIWLMGIVLKTGNKKQEKKEEPKAASAPAPVVESVDVTDDTELIAVISAAIAAASKTSSDGFVVRSVKRRSGKWNRA